MRFVKLSELSEEEKVRSAVGGVPAPPIPLPLLLLLLILLPLPLSAAPDAARSSAPIDRTQ